jgi:hypothetical protein
VQGPPVGALTVANSTAGASQAAVPTTTGSTNNNHPSIIIVEFIGYGGGESDSPPQPQGDDHRQKSQDQRSYNTNSVLQLVGNGPLSEDQERALTTDERKNLDDH